MHILSSKFSNAPKGKNLSVSEGWRLVFLPFLWQSSLSVCKGVSCFSDYFNTAHRFMWEVEADPGIHTPTRRGCTVTACTHVQSSFWDANLLTKEEEYMLTYNYRYSWLYLSQGNKWTFLADKRLDCNPTLYEIYVRKEINLICKSLFGNSF